MEVLIFPCSVGPNTGHFTTKHVFLTSSTLIFIFYMLKTTIGVLTYFQIGEIFKISGSSTAVSIILPTVVSLFKQQSVENFRSLKSESQSSLSGLMNTHICLSYHGQTTAFVNGCFPLTREKIVFHRLSRKDKNASEMWSWGMEQSFHELRRMWMCCKVGKKNALADTSGSESGKNPSAQVGFTVTRSTLKCKSSRSTMFIVYSQFYLC